MREELISALLTYAFDSIENAANLTQCLCDINSDSDEDTVNVYITAGAEIESYYKSNEISL